MRWAVFVSLSVVGGMVGAAAPARAQAASDDVREILRGIQERENRLSTVAWDGTCTTTVPGPAPGTVPDGSSRVMQPGVRRTNVRWARRGKLIGVAIQSPNDHVVRTSKGLRNYLLREGLASGATLDEWWDVSVFDGKTRLQALGQTFPGGGHFATLAIGAEAPDPLDRVQLAGMTGAVQTLAVALKSGTLTCGECTWRGLRCRRLAWRVSLAEPPRRFWVAPDLGFAVVREENLSGDGWLNVEVERWPLRKMASAHGEPVWVPTQVERRLYGLAQPSSTFLGSQAVLKLDRVRFDFPAHDYFLDLTLDSLPVGTRVHDEISNEQYKAGPVGGHDGSMRGLARQLRAFALRPELRRLPKKPSRGDSEARHMGPRALMLLCCLYGGDALTSELVQLSGTDAHGTTMAGLAKAAQAKGFGATVVTAPAEILAQEGKPAILATGRNRFALFVGAAGGKVVLVEPPTGLRIMPVPSLTQQVPGPRAVLRVEPPPGVTPPPEAQPVPKTLTVGLAVVSLLFPVTVFLLLRRAARRPSKGRAT
jgi:hypothetical protein